MTIEVSYMLPTDGIQFCPMWSGPFVFKIIITFATGKKKCIKGTVALEFDCCLFE